MTLRGILVGGLIGFALSFGCAPAQTVPSSSPTPSPAATPPPARDAQGGRRDARAHARVDHRRRAAGDRSAAARERCGADASAISRADSGRGRARFADPGGDAVETEKEAAAAPAAVGDGAIDRPVADVSARHVPRDLQGCRALRGDRAGRRLADRHPGVAPGRHWRGRRRNCASAFPSKATSTRRRQSMAPPPRSGAPN